MKPAEGTRVALASGSEPKAASYIQAPFPCSSTRTNNEGASIHYADPNNYADEASANIGCADFVERLRGFDRDLARLLIHGETETISLTCGCGDSEHSYIADLARALNCKESRIFKGLRRLRDAAAKEFDAA